MKHRQSMVAVTATLLALSVCQSATAAEASKPTATPPAQGTSLPTINGKPLDADQFNIYVNNIVQQQGGTPPTAEQQQNFVAQYVRMQLAADAAEKEGLEKTKDVQTQMKFSRTSILADASVRKYLAENPTSDADVKAEYEAEIASMPLEYHTRHVLLENEADANAVVKQLKAGGDFAKIAQTRSKDPSSKDGGDLGWLDTHSMAQPYAEAVVKLEKGKYTEQPVKTEYGWHVIKLEESRTMSAPPFDEVKDRVKGFLQRKKVEIFLDGLSAKAKVEGQH